MPTMKIKSKVSSSIILLVLTSLVGGGYLIKKRTTSNPYTYKFRLIESATSQTDLEILVKKHLEAPSNPYTLDALSWAYLAKAKETDDPELYNKAMEFAGKYSKLNLGRNSNPGLIMAQLHQAQHQFDDAIKIALPLLLKTSDIGALQILVTSYLALGELDKAAERAVQWVYRLPSLTSYVMLALVQEAQGRNSEAEQSFKSALRVEDIGEEWAGAWGRSLYARHLMQMGNLGEAKKLIEAALAIRPKDPFALLQLADFNFKKENFKIASDLYFKIFTEHQKLIALIGYIHTKKAMNEIETAKEWITKSEELARKQIGTSKFGHRLELVQILLEKETSEAAKEAMLIVQEETKVRKDANTYYWLAKSFSAVKEIPRARMAIQNTLATGAIKADYYLLAGELEESVQSVHRALLYYSLALELDPNLKAAAKGRQRLQQYS